MSAGRRHHQDRAGRVLQHLPRCAPQEELLQAAVAVGPDDDRLGVALAGEPVERLGDRHLIGHGEALGLEPQLGGEPGATLASC